MTTVSVVIPTINEAENIVKLIPQVEAVYKENGISGEIIVVDDLSKDGTAQKAQEAGRAYGNVKVISRQVRNGLGRALKEGVEAGSGEYVIFMDADLSHEPKEIPHFIKALASSDVVVGSRYMLGSRLKRSISRRIISGSYNLFSKVVLGVNVSDTSSGYRGFRKEAFKKLKITSSGPEIHAELVVKACVAGMRVSEIPVSYIDRIHGETKLNYLKVGPSYFLVLLNGFISTAAKLLRI